MYHVQCQNCLATGFTEDGSHLDHAVQCTTSAGDPPGSAGGTCCTTHQSHEDHLAGVEGTGDASCRPVIVTVVPGSVRLSASGGA